MQASSGRQISSVSDLYGTDEIDDLLEEIRDLEPASCRAADVQDFEIAGSRTAVAPLESPAGTVRSWDSHANYRHDNGTSPNGSFFSGVILHFDESAFRSSTGVLRLLLVISIVACLACLCSSGTVKVGVFMLPLAGRLRLMLFVTIFSLLVTCLFLFLDISHIIYLFPLNWGKLTALLYVGISVLYLIASSLIVHMIHDEAFTWVPKWSKDQLLITGILGYICGFEGILISLVTKWHRVQYCPVDGEAGDIPSMPPTQLMLEENRPRPTPPAIHQTRRHMDNAQPCSSKTLDANNMA